MKLHWKKYPYY